MTTRVAMERLNQYADSVTAWADQLRTSESDVYKDSKVQSLVPVFTLILNHGITSDAAANRVSKLFQQLVISNSSDIRNTVVWEILCGAVRAFGDSKETNERLSDFVAAFRSQPDVKDEHAQSIKSGAKVFSKDLPEIATTFRHYGVFLDLDDDDNMTESRWCDLIPRYFNANFFAATHMARANADWSFFAEACLTRALESPPKPQSAEARASMYVPPAATWVTVAGSKIYKLCKDEQGHMEFVPMSHEYVAGGGGGFSLKRWAFWKDTFQGISRNDGLSESFREIARKAAETMTTVEGKL